MEASTVGSDYKNLLRMTDIATLYLDRDLRTKIHSSDLGDTLKLDGDTEDPVAHLSDHLDYPDLKDDARKVVKNQEAMEREVQDGSGRWYLIRFRPHQKKNGMDEGVVITLVDITRLKGVEKEMSEEKEYAELLFDTVREGLLVLDDKLRVKSGNESFYQMFGVTPGETEGTLLYELGDGQWDIPELRTLLEHVLPDNTVMNDYEIEHEFEDIGRRVMLLNARRIDHMQIILLAIEDITQRKEAMSDLQDVNTSLEARVDERTKQVRKLVSRLTESEQRERRRISRILHDDLQQILFAIQMNLSFINRTIEQKSTDRLPEQIDEVLEMTDSAIDKTRQLTGDLNPFVLKSSKVTELLEWVTDRFEQMYDLKTELRLTDQVIIEDEKVRVMLLQIVRELLFNVVKHAETDEALIQINNTLDHCLVLSVVDEGRGFELKKEGDPVENREGFGLFNIRERLQLYGGSLEMHSAPGEGTRMTLRLPVDAAKGDSEDDAADS